MAQVGRAIGESLQNVQNRSIGTFDLGIESDFVRDEFHDLILGGLIRAILSKHDEDAFGDQSSEVDVVEEAGAQSGWCWDVDRQDGLPLLIDGCELE